MSEVIKKIKKTLQAKVIGKNSANTVKVKVEIKQPHPLYKRIVRKHKTYLVHATDELFAQVQVGAEVTIEEAGRKISKRKTWVLKELI